MKRFLAAALLFALILLLCGCEFRSKLIHETDYAGRVSFPASIWVSPDGVEYFVYYDGNRMGMAPRLDTNGHVVVWGEEAE